MNELKFSRIVFLFIFLFIQHNVIYAMKRDVYQTRSTTKRNGPGPKNNAYDTLNKKHTLKKPKYVPIEKNEDIDVFTLDEDNSDADIDVFTLDDNTEKPPHSLKISDSVHFLLSHGNFPDNSLFPELEYTHYTHDRLPSDFHNDMAWIETL